MATLQMRDFGKRTDMYMVDPRKIVIEKGHNPRNYKLAENRQHLDSLKLSISTEGVIKPLLCRLEAEQVILLDGECRLRASLELIKEFEAGKGGAEIAAVPVKMVKAGTEAERAFIAHAANTGKPLSQWEAGEHFRKMAKWGHAVEEIAQRLGYTPRYVSQAIELADAPAEIKEQLSEQAVTPAHAIRTIRKRGAARAITELKEQVATAKASGKKGPVKAEKSKKPVAINAFEKLMRDIVKEIEPDWPKDGAEEEAPFMSVSTKLLVKARRMVADDVLLTSTTKARKSGKE